MIIVLNRFLSTSKLMGLLSGPGNSPIRVYMYFKGLTFLINDADRDKHPFISESTTKKLVLRSAAVTYVGSHISRTWRQFKTRWRQTSAPSEVAPIRRTYCPFTLSIALSPKTALTRDKY